MTINLTKSLLPCLFLCHALRGIAVAADSPEETARKATIAQRVALNQAVDQKSGTVESFEKGLTDKDPIVRALSVRGLEGVGAAANAAVVAPLLLKDPDPSVREEAAEALKTWKNPASLSALVKGAADPVVSIRVVCLEALGESPDPAAHKAVLAAAKDAAPEVRRTVMNQFAHASSPDVVPAVTAALSDTDPSVRANAAQAISFYAKLHMPAELKNLLQDSDPTVQASAARSLIQAGDADGVKTALGLVKSEDQAARLISIDALGYTQEADAKAALAQIIGEDKDLYDREAAQLSLKRMGLKHK